MGNGCAVPLREVLLMRRRPTGAAEAATGPAPQQWRWRVYGFRFCGSRKAPPIKNQTTPQDSVYIRLVENYVEIVYKSIVSCRFRQVAAKLCPGAARTFWLTTRCGASGSEAIVA